MFKELRDKFLMLNLIIISILMIIAFIAIYFITYKNVHSSIDRELRRIAEFNDRPITSYSYKPVIPGKPVRGADNNSVQKRTVSFGIIIDGSWNVKEIISMFEMEDNFYINAKNAVLHQNKPKGTFKLDENLWAFQKLPIPEGYKIVFLDITSQQDILTRLTSTFLIIAFIMLIFIYLISRYFANKAIAPIKDAFEKQKQFIADASHELKTPLSVMNTNIDVLLSNTEIAASSEAKWLYYIQNETERMTKLTNNLLYLTQVDYSDENTIFSRFDYSEVVLNALLTMEAVIFENKISLDYDIEPQIFIYGCCEQLQQVIMILLDNACKYVNSQGFIKVSLTKQHNQVILAVTNTGDGIPESDIDKIFDRFYRLDKARSRASGGYGLGLAIASAIVKQHKGKIYAKSTLQEHTTFYIELPVPSSVS